MAYSLIVELTGTLTRVKPRWKIVVVLYADKDAAEVAACLQKLKWSLDSFVVGIPRLLMIEPWLKYDTARDYDHDRVRNTGLSVVHVDHPWVLNARIGNKNRIARRVRQD